MSNVISTSDYPWRDPIRWLSRLAVDVFLQVLVHEQHNLLPKTVTQVVNLSREYYKQRVSSDYFRVVSNKSDIARAIDQTILRACNAGGGYPQVLVDARTPMEIDHLMVYTKKKINYFLDRLKPDDLVVSDIVDIAETEAKWRARDAGLKKHKAIDAFINIWLAGEHAQAYAFADRILSYEK